MFGLLPTSGENVMSTAPLEIYLLRKIMTCHMLNTYFTCYSYCVFDYNFDLKPINYHVNTPNEK